MKIMLKRGALRSFWVAYTGVDIGLTSNFIANIDGHRFLNVSQAFELVNEMGDCSLAVTFKHAVDELYKSMMEGV